MQPVPEAERVREWVQIEGIDEADRQLALDQVGHAEHQQGGLGGDRVQLRPEKAVQQHEEDDHGDAEPGRDRRGQEAGHQQAGDEGMAGAVRDPCRESDGGACQLQGEEADDARQEAERDQQSRGTPEEEDTQGECRGERDCVRDVVAELLGIDEEGLRDGTDRSERLTHASIVVDDLCYPYSVFSRISRQSA